MLNVSIIVMLIALEETDINLLYDDNSLIVHSNALYMATLNQLCAEQNLLTNLDEIRSKRKFFLETVNRKPCREPITFLRIPQTSDRSPAIPSFLLVRNN